MPRHRRGWAVENNSPENARHTPLTTSLLEPFLLLLIDNEPRHGYLLLNDLENFGLGTVHPSLVYRTLRDMEALMWIESKWDTNQTQGPPRRIYSLLPAGKAILISWKSELEKARVLIGKFLSGMES